MRRQEYDELTLYDDLEIIASLILAFFTLFFFCLFLLSKTGGI